MDVIEQIGAYAGFASVLGLGVLAALYFSQARDVKRLREWAGRAPERAPITRPPVVARPVPRPPGQGTMPPRPPVPPVPRPPGAARPPGPPGAPPPPPGAYPRPGVPPPPPPGAPRPGTPPGAPPATPAAQPSPAASATGAAPPEAKAPAPADESSDGPEAGDRPEPGTPPAPTATSAEAAAPKPATPAAAAGTALPPRSESSNGSEESGGDTAMHELEPDEPETAYDELEDEEEYEPDEPELHDEPLDPDAPEQHWEDTGDYVPAGAVPGRPTIPIGAGRDPAPAPAPSTSPPILPPYQQIRPGGEVPDRQEDALATPGRIFAVIAATVIAAVVVALAIVQLGGEDEGGTPASENAQEGSPSGDERKPPSTGGVNPRNVTVAVLNGTTVPGLAAKIGDSIKRRGFQLGNVANFIDQQRAESVVLYSPGAEREAAAVGRRLDIPQREPVDAESQDIAGDATVVVVAGADQNP